MKYDIELSKRSIQWVMQACGRKSDARQLDYVVFCYWRELLLAVVGTDGRVLNILPVSEKWREIMTQMYDQCVMIGFTPADMVQMGVKLKAGIKNDQNLVISMDDEVEPPINADEGKKLKVQGIDKPVFATVLEKFPAMIAKVIPTLDDLEHRLYNGGLCHMQMLSHYSSIDTKFTKVGETCGTTICETMLSVGIPKSMDAKVGFNPDHMRWQKDFVYITQPNLERAIPLDGDGDMDYTVEIDVQANKDYTTLSVFVNAFVIPTPADKDMWPRSIIKPTIPDEPEKKKK